MCEKGRGRKRRTLKGLSDLWAAGEETSREKELNGDREGEDEGRQRREKRLNDSLKMFFQWTEKHNNGNVLTSTLIASY